MTVANQKLAFQLLTNQRPLENVSSVLWVFVSNSNCVSADTPLLPHMWPLYEQPGADVTLWTLRPWFPCPSVTHQANVLLMVLNYTPSVLTYSWRSLNGNTSPLDDGQAYMLQGLENMKLKIFFKMFCVFHIYLYLRCMYIIYVLLEPYIVRFPWLAAEPDQGHSCLSQWHAPLLRGLVTGHLVTTHDGNTLPSPTLNTALRVSPGWWHWHHGLTTRPSFLRQMPRRASNPIAPFAVFRNWRKASAATAFPGCQRDFNTLIRDWELKLTLLSLLYDMKHGYLDTFI